MPRRYNAFAMSKLSGYFCGSVLPTLAKRYKVLPDRTLTTADADISRWIWVDHEQAFCQIYSSGNIAVKCDCSACSHNEERTPTTEGHCTKCACRECACQARVKTDRIDKSAKKIEPDEKKGVLVCKLLQ